MEDRKTKKLVMTSLFAALICAATMIVQIPSPTQGYVNLGDCFIMVGAWLLGPWYGALAGGIGSALSDVLFGYTYYAPGTFVIKGLSAITAGFLFNIMKNKRNSVNKNGKHTKKNLIYCIASSIPAEIIVILGYLGYSALILGRGDAALLSVPGNIFQATVGVTAGTILYSALDRTHIIGKVL